MKPVDGQHVKTGMGDRTFEVFAPPPWRIDRWIYFLFTRRTKGHITMSEIVGDHRGKRVVHHEVRVLGVATRRRDL
jgi:hypothetical protein